MSENVFWAQNAQMWLFDPRRPQIENIVFLFSLEATTLLALITPALNGVNFGLLALLGPALQGPHFSRFNLLSGVILRVFLCHFEPKENFP